jgi:hypothetical protein
VNFLTLQYLTPLKREIQLELEREQTGTDNSLDD